MNEEFVYLKLVTGETLMALKEYEDEESIVVKFPMLVKMHLISSKDGRVSEQVTAGPYSLFVENSVLTINRHHIVFDSQLAIRAIPHYVGLVKDHEGITLDYMQEQLNWKESEEQISAIEDIDTIQNIKSAVAQLESVAEEDIEQKVFIQGNETIH
jgi:hypothetical protein